MVLGMVVGTVVSTRKEEELTSLKFLLVKACDASGKLLGGGNNLIVEMDDHLVIFDSPYGEAQSRATIDLAKAKDPGKPIKYLVQTHHHMDHSGGMRTYVAEGATVLVAAQTQAYFNKAMRNARKVANDSQEKARKPIEQAVREADVVCACTHAAEIPTY